VGGGICDTRQGWVPLLVNDSFVRRYLMRAIAIDDPVA